MRLAILIALLVGCGDNLEPDARVYTCTVLYRCAGDIDVRARIGLPCAVDLEDALEQATETVIGATDETCPGAWQYVRPVCKPYEPETTCDLSR